MFTIIIPCYNESKRISKTMSQIKEVLSVYKQSEAIFVDDGSKDATAEIIKANLGKRMRLIELPVNQGKWGAIKAGFLSSKKKLCVLSDADYSVSLMYLKYHIGFEDIVVGNRYNSYNDIPWARWVLGKGFNGLVKAIIGLDLPDTQSPYKIFRKEALKPIICDMCEHGFAGDVEFLQRASLAGLEISTIDIHYEFIEGSSVNLVTTPWQMFKSLFIIRHNISSDLYYSGQ